jgi:hypothetical protein
LLKIKSFSAVFVLLVLPSPLLGQLKYPIDLAVHGDDVLIVDRNLPGLFRVDGGANQSVVYQGSKKFRTPLNAARCVAVAPNGDIFVGDSSTRQIYRMGETPEKLLTNSIGIGIPYAMAFNKAGDLFIADLEAPGQIHRVKKGQTIPESFALQAGIRGLAFDKAGDLLAVTGLDEALIKFKMDGSREVILAKRPFDFPNGIAVLGEDMFISDSYKKCVWKIGPDKKPLAWCTQGLSYPGGIAVKGDQIWVTDAKAKKIFSIAADGTAKEVKLQ